MAASLSMSGDSLPNDDIARVTVGSSTSSSLPMTSAARSSPSARRTTAAFSGPARLSNFFSASFALDIVNRPRHVRPQHAHASLSRRRSDEHTYELQTLMRSSYDVFGL